MPTTIDDLVKWCMFDTMPPIPVVADYFGLNNIENLCVIFRSISKYDY